MLIVVLLMDIFKFFLMTSVLGGLISGGATNMRGLNEFISDIRECKDKESETKRV